MYKCFFEEKIKQFCSSIKALPDKWYEQFCSFIQPSGDGIKRNIYNLFLFAFITCFMVLFIGLVAIDRKEGSLVLNEFGDFFGGVLNPILTFLTFIGLLITIVLQQRELSLSREELVLTRGELKNSSEALASQALTQESQRFENTFFSLLNQHNLILSSLMKGASADDNSPIDILISQVSNADYFVDNELSIYDYSDLIRKDSISSHYFITLYQLLKLIATKYPRSEIGLDFDKNKLIESSASGEERFYSNIVRASLNHKVIQILAVNCFCKDEADSYFKYKLLIERYRFLEHMPFSHNSTGNFSDLLLKATVEYNEKAFGNSIFLDAYKKELKEPDRKSLFEKLSI